MIVYCRLVLCSPYLFIIIIWCSPMFIVTASVWRRLTSMMAALLSRCLYSSLSTSLSFFMFFLLGWSSMAWKFTGSPYLRNKRSLLLRKTYIKRDGWKDNQSMERMNESYSFMKAAGCSPAYLNTDSTNTRRAFMWIHAMKASLKFTFSHRTRGPWVEINSTLIFYNKS